MFLSEARGKMNKKTVIRYEVIRKINEEDCVPGESYTGERYRTDKVPELLEKIAVGDRDFMASTDFSCNRYRIPYKSSTIFIDLGYCDHSPTNKYGLDLIITHFLGKKFTLPREIKKIIKKYNLKELKSKK